MRYELNSPADPRNISLEADFRDGQIELDRELAQLTRQVETTSLVLIFTVSIYLFLFQAWTPVAPLFILAPVLAYIYSLVRRVVRYRRLRRRFNIRHQLSIEAARSLHD